MLVKCQDTGEKIEKELAYKIEHISSSGKKSYKYYSSEDAYNKIVHENKFRKLCVDMMYDILNYKSFMKMPTYFFKKLTEWEPYGYEVIYICINDNKSNIEWALNNKQFNQETGKIMYICAILENHMNDALKIYNTQLQNVKEEKKEIDIAFDVEIGTSKKSKDITSLLGDL